MRKALIELREMRAKLDSFERARSEPIAIIGMGCRFPGGANPLAFWEVLVEGRDAVVEAPKDRWDVAAYYDPDPDAPGKMYTCAGGYIDDVDKFSPAFFGIAPREAVSLDPQQRILLEVAWEAIEHAALAPERLLRSQLGVFIGISGTDYSDLLLQRGPAEIDAYLGTGTSNSTAAGRLSYLLGVQGPCLALDTACSSSLTAVHLAVMSLRSGESDLALAGGVNLILLPELSINFCKAHMLSPEGRCKTFDATANGYVRGEGCGIIVLKRLSDALTDRDNILAVIRGSALNHDGRTSGLTVPSGPSQQAVIRQALHNAGLKPSEVSYVEAHGTGTQLGDPIEVNALGAVFQERTQPLLIGSAKTNIGHLEAAAGIAGLIKVVLALQHGQIPPHLHFREPNPHIAWDDLPVRVVTELRPWPAGRRIAGMSSFGFGGTNVHVVLEEAPTIASIPVDVERPVHVFTLSAKTEEALRDLADRYVHVFSDQAPGAIENVCFTANTGRAHFEHRLSMVAASCSAMLEPLRTFAAGEKPASMQVGHVLHARPRVAMLFTGQGSQYAGMGRELYETQPTFRRTLERCDAILRPYLAYPLLDVLYPKDDASDAQRQYIHQTAYTQPALFALEYALAELWQSWGVRPHIVLGHSVGEYVAACVAGVFSLEDGLRLIAERGRLMQALPQNGAMVAVRAAEARVAPAVAPYSDTVSIAAVNGPQDVVISGERQAVEAIAAQLQAEGMTTRPLTVSHAFHSPLMEPMLAEFEHMAKTVQYAVPRLGLISNVTGQEALAEVTESYYWVRHVRDAVRFASGMATLASQECEVFLEVGPQPTLLGLGRQCIPEPQAVWLPSLRSRRGDWQQLLESLGTLYVQGVEIDWVGFDRDYTRHKVELPTYPFQRQRYWLSDSPQRSRQARGSLRPLIDTMVQSPLLKETIFTTQFSTTAFPYLADHQVFDAVVVPGACHLAIILSGAELLGLDACRLEDVFWPAPLVLTDTEERTVQAVLTPEESASDGVQQAAAFQLISLAAAGAPDEVLTHMTGRLRGQVHSALPVVALADVQARCQEAVEPEALYAAASAHAVEFGPSFRWIEALWRGEGEALGRLRLPEAVESMAGYWLHPGLLDACFQVAGATLRDGAVTEALLPFRVTNLQVSSVAAGQVWWCRAVQVDESIWDIQLCDATGQVMADIKGFEMRQAPRQTFLRRQAADWLYRVEWQPQPLAGEASPGAAGSWLIFSDDNGLGDKLAAQLLGHGQRCVVVTQGDVYSTADEQSEVGAIQRAVLNPQVPADFQRLLATTLTAEQPPCRGIIYLWSAELPREASEMPTLAQALSVGVLHLVQALRSAGMAPRLWLVTRGSQAVDGTEPVHVAQAPVWGLGRTLSLECPELQCVCVDLAPGAETDNVDALLAELWSPAGEVQVAFRSGTRHVARLVRHHDTRKLGPDGPFRVQLANYGTPDQLQLVPLTRRPPDPGEVEIEVKATALNFRDVLNALGLLKEYYAAALGIDRAQDVPLGFECAGTIVAVGDGVAGFAVGDEVMAAAEGSFASFVTVGSASVVHKPAGLSFAAAAAIPTVFSTAYYGLHVLAQLQPGERVLIHAAAGGVGQAAVQLAQAAGAEIFATASPSKWEFLKSQGIHHVMNSRTLDFADEILRLTHGAGVDVVLNSLSGAFIDKSFAVLKHGGRFVEIGKLGIWEPQQVLERRPDAAYYPFDLGEVTRADPALMTSILAQVAQWFEAGRLHPLPQTVFPVPEVVEAFRYMQQAKQVGKVVLTLASESTTAIRADSSYLITGGLGGLGLKVAQHLVEHGARHVVLTGRSGAVSAQAQDAVQQLQAAGAAVVVVPADVAQAEEVARVLEVCQAQAPLRGIVHAAGVLDDGVVQQQTAERFARVMAPKVHGAWHLHMQSQGLPLDFFVGFSSMAALLGAPGQSNYAAANAFLDALAHHRRARGLAGLSINWGPWAEVGMASELSLAEQGIDKIDVGSGMQILTALLQPAQPNAPAQVGVFRVHWPTFQQHFPAGAAPPFFSPLLRRAAPAQAAVTDNFLRRLHAVPAGEREGLLEAYIHDQLVQVLGLEASHDMAPTQSWQGLGLDSLMTVELKNRLERTLRVTLPVEKIMQDVNTQILTTFLLDKLHAADHQGVETVPAEDPHGSTDELAEVLEFVRQLPQAYVVVKKQQARQVLVDGRWRCDFASCNYLGLDLHPQVMEAIPAALAEWGVHPSWTRAVASPGIYAELEQELANLVGAPMVLMFPSISLLHLGVLPILAGFNGVILKDTAAHHSIHEACLRAQADGVEWQDFRHNDVDDLTQKLARYRPERTKIIATDGVYSMGGDYPPLHEYVRLAKTYNALVYVDDAHGLGVIGENPNVALPYGYRGSGLVRHYGLDYAADRIVYVAGLSKAFSSYGAFVTCVDDQMRAKLGLAGPFIFSGPSPVASLASALAGLRINRQEGDRQRQYIYRLTQQFVTAVKAIGFEVDNGGFFPIVGVVIGHLEEMIKACQLLWEHNILITPATYPAVPMHRNLVRFSITAANTEAEVEQAIKALEAVWQMLPSRKSP